MGMHFRLEEVTPKELARCLKSPRPIRKSGSEEQFEQMAEYIARAAKSDPAIKKRLEEYQPTPRILERRAHPELAAHMQKIESELQSMIMDRVKGHSKATTKPHAADQIRSENVLLLEKEWHVLHYALNGTSEATNSPIGQSILGGTDMPNAAASDYGPPRFLKPETVNKIAKALEKVDSQKLVSKLDAADAEAKHIYLAHTISRPHDWDHLPDLFQRFKTFYTNAAVRGNAVIMYLT